MQKRALMVAALAVALGTGLPGRAAAAGCAPVASLHLYGNDRFDIGLPRGVIIQGPGSTPTSFYLDLDGMPGLKSRLQYSEPSGLLRVENGFMAGSGADWNIYPSTLACQGLAARLGHTQSVRATSPGDVNTLPQNSITTGPSR